MFPYEYIPDDSRLMESKIHSKEHLYSELKGENISDDGYNFTFKLFKLQNLKL